MKKVAFIADGWKRLIIYAWIDGIYNKMQDYPEEVTLHYYNCYGNWSVDELHNQGEYNIYNVPNFKEYDGIIMDLNNILDQRQKEYVVKLVKDSGVPAVSIGEDIDGFYYAGIDNKQPITEMLEHMYDVHDCRSYVFAGGPKDNYENESRIQAYKKFLEKHGLTESNNPVFYGDYEFDNGIVFFKEYIASGKPLPDVVICACDNIAAGVCTQAEKMGYRIPEDFRVTGFDNLDKASFFRPQIATVDHHDRGLISAKCMDVLFDIWNGRDAEKYNFTDATCIFAESCGCENSGKVNYREYIKDNIIYGVYQAKKEEKTNELETVMSKCGEFSEIYKYMRDYICGLDCDGFFVVADDALTNAKPRNHFKTKGYNFDNMKVVCAYDEGKELGFTSVDELNNYIDASGGKSAYVYTPIHFKQHSVGYSILKNPRFLYSDTYFYDLHNILVKNMESLYDHIKLSVANKKLKDIYNKDQLTGIYNRVAYAEMIAPEFKRYYEDDVVCAIAFIDVDKFKLINDTYGHEYGDEVLKKIANIIKDKCPKNGYACRYGGDEFILFFPYATQELADSVKDAINEAAAAINIELSIGMILSSTDYGSDVNAYFEVADKYMYEEKMRHKQK